MGNHVIRDRIWVSDKLSKCSLPAALAFPWVFLICDDWGRFEYRPRAIWGQVFGSREDVSVDDVKRWLAEYERHGLLVRYHIDGDLAFWTGFEGRPDNRRRKSRYPDPKCFERVELREPAAISRETAQDRAEMLPLAEQSRAEQETETEHVTGAVQASDGANGNGHGNGVPEEQRQEYADAVWREFLRVSGQRPTRMMTPGEFIALKGWMDSGVPLALVLRGIEDTRGKASAKSLGYFGPSVKGAIEQWRKAVPL
jgi:hypothetical protein